MTLPAKGDGYIGVGGGTVSLFPPVPCQEGGGVVSPFRSIPNYLPRNGTEMERTAWKHSSPSLRHDSIVLLLMVVHLVVYDLVEVGFLLLSCFHHIHYIAKDFFGAFALCHPCGTETEYTEIVVKSRVV